MSDDHATTFPLSNKTVESCRVIRNLLKIVTPTLTQVSGNGGDNLALNMLACDCMFNYAFKGLIVVLDDRSIQD